MSIFLYNYTLFGFVAPISISMLTGLRAIFRNVSIYGANMGFHALTFARSLGRCLNSRATYLVVIEGHLISQSYRGEFCLV